MVSLLFSFRGRISRKQYWVGTTLVGFASAIGRMLTTALSAGEISAAKDPADMIASAAGSSVVALPLFAVIVWCSLAIQFKRFHDRGRTGWLSLAPLVVGLMLIASIIGDVIAKAPLERLFNDALPYFVVLMVIGLAFFIDLGCLESVEGLNKYGPPPGAPPSPLEPARPSGAVDAASSLFGAQSAMDRAIADASKPRPAVQRLTPPAPAAPRPAAPAPPAPASFGRRVAR